MAACKRKMEEESVTLSNGMKHPLLGFGTYKLGVVPASAASASTAGVLRPAKDVVLDAIKAGYRSFDCAHFYLNHDKVGEAFAESGVPREELFIVSKVWTTAIAEGEEAVRKQVELALKDLKTPYLDLCLIHWPVPGKHVAAYKALEKLVDEGLVKAIGLSNYTIEDYKELEAAQIRIPPAVNQLEISPWLFRKNTAAFFQEHGVMLQSYRTLRQGKALEDPLVIEIAKKVGRTPSQVVGRWCVQHGFAYFPKTQTFSRMQENASIFDFTLEESDMQRLDALTTTAAIAAFRKLYNTGIVRDTPLQDTLKVDDRVVTED